MIRSALLLTLFLTGCGVRDLSAGLTDGGTEALCAPTGRSLVSTGVYIAPEACTDVTLYALEVPDSGVPDAWVLKVGWPMYGEYHVLELTNRTTGDTEKELFYSGDPEFTLSSGNYALGSFKMAAGDNAIDFVVYNTIRRAPGSTSA
ncbi:MAG: hypothetical protein ACOZQL_36175 [Myxococcota bacterium]